MFKSTEDSRKKIVNSLKKSKKYFKAKLHDKKKLCQTIKIKKFYWKRINTNIAPLKVLIKLTISLFIQLIPDIL